MNPRKYQFKQGTGGAAIAVKITPRAKKNEISEVLEDGTVKIKLTAAPVEGKANQELVAFLADFFKLPASKIEIVAGQTSRNKLIAIAGLDPQTVQTKILAALSR